MGSLTEIRTNDQFERIVSLYKFVVVYFYSPFLKGHPNHSTLKWLAYSHSRSNDVVFCKANVENKLIGGWINHALSSSFPLVRIYRNTLAVVNLYSPSSLELERVVNEQISPSTTLSTGENYMKEGNGEYNNFFDIPLSPLGGGSPRSPRSPGYSRSPVS